MHNAVYPSSEANFKEAIEEIISLHKQFQPNHFERIFILIIDKAEECKKKYSEKSEVIARTVEELYYLLSYIVEDKINFEIENNSKFFAQKYRAEDVISRITTIIYAGDISVIAFTVGEEVLKAIVNWIAFKIKEQRLMEIRSNLYLQMTRTLITISRSKIYLPGRYSLIINTFKANQHALLKNAYLCEGVDAYMDLVAAFVPFNEHWKFYEHLKKLLCEGKPEKKSILEDMFFKEYKTDWEDIVAFVGYLGAAKSTFYKEYRREFRRMKKAELRARFPGSWVFLLVGCISLIGTLILGTSSSEFSGALTSTVIFLSIYSIVRIKIWSNMSKFDRMIKRSIANHMAAYPVQSNIRSTTERLPDVLQ